ncbi:MAG TPA: tetratricopeptide repeat protein, partial [Pseudolabrys sp.]|nr:tetratricopeptide repeat protein [Pseudolabrys sp.]
MTATTASAAVLSDVLQRAVAAFRAGRVAEAENLCADIVAAQPDQFDAAHVLAVAQAAQGKFELALASYDRALTLRPESAEVISNRGTCLERLGRLDEALASYEHALSARPDFVDAHYNRGNVLLALQRHAEALASYDHVLALKPDHADALNNRGQALRELMRYNDALASYDAAIARQPQHVMAHCNAAALRLLMGDFPRGWAEYEWRWKKASVVRFARKFVEPVWRGEPIAGKTILIHSEQGLGDTIQFCRYVPLIAARGARVIFEVEPPLYGLMSAFANVAQIVPKGSALPRFDLHCPLLSLPLAFGTTLETIPAEPAYLRAPAPQTEYWRARLAGKRRPLIGLAWAGNPKHERDGERSIALRALLPLLDVEASFVSLQKDVRPDDAAALRERADILQAGDALKDFSDTAGLVSSLDLVISVDTSVAHLSAALGKPTWILLTFVPDFRWL